MDYRLLTTACVSLLLLTATGLCAQTLPLFDSHSHFKSEESEVFSAADVVAILDEQNIQRMVNIARVMNYVRRAFLSQLVVYEVSGCVMV